jgi:hypothetical protein
MKKGSFIYNFVVVVAAFVIAGCGGGGGNNVIQGNGQGGGDNNPPSQIEPRLTGLSTIVGDLHKSDVNATAILKLDIDADNSFDSKYDKTLKTLVREGRFEFSNIPVLEDKEVTGQLIVEVEGYAPYQTIVTLKNGESLTIDASAAFNKVLFKQSVNLSKAGSESVRSGVIEFGIKKVGNKLKPFSKFISLSEFRAMANGESNVSLGDGSLSSYYVDVSSIPEDVKIIEATMQSFDSTKEEDLQHFPGEFKGIGLSKTQKQAMKFTVWNR